MNRAFLTMLTGILITGFSLVGEANPIMCEVLQLRQTPLTEHVQVTFADDCSESFEILSVEKDGEPLSVEWTPFAGYTTNTGSGLRELNSEQACDCDVFLGEHEYIVHARRGGVNPDIADIDFPYTIVVKRAEDVPAPVPVDEDTDTYEYGWDIPDPVEVQGLDCEARCGGETDGGLSDTDSVGQDTDTVADAGPDEDEVETDVADQGATDDGDTGKETGGDSSGEKMDTDEDGEPDEDGVGDDVADDGDDDLGGDVADDGDDDVGGDVADDGDEEAAGDGDEGAAGDGDEGATDNGDKGDEKAADPESPGGEAGGCSAPGRIGTSSHAGLSALLGLMALLAFAWRNHLRQ